MSLYGGSIHFISFCIVFSCTNTPLCVHLEMDVWFVHFATLRETAHRNILARVCRCACTPGAPAESAVVDAAKRFPQALVPADTLAGSVQASGVLSFLSRMWRPPFFVFVFFLSVILVIGGEGFTLHFPDDEWCDVPFRVLLAT